MDGQVIVAGATGALGGRIVDALLARGAAVRALVRRGGAVERAAALAQRGAEVAEVAFDRIEELERACAGGACVVSALSGLREAVIDAQSALLDAAVAAGVPRFIPSDFSIDFTRLIPGTNRNLDLRREFRERLEAAPIAATSVLCGMFMELLAGTAPIVLFPLRRVLVWGSADQPLDFTTVADTAAFTAAAALDAATPRFLRIAGDRCSARQLAEAVSRVTGKPFRLLRGGSLARLERLIAVARVLAPGRHALYPPWQGMQYLRDMFSGRGALDPLDNHRYPELRWTSVEEFLAARR